LHQEIIFLFIRVRHIVRFSFIHFESRQEYDVNEMSFF